MRVCVCVCGENSYRYEKHIIDLRLHFDYTAANLPGQFCWQILVQKDGNAESAEEQNIILIILITIVNQLTLFSSHRQLVSALQYSGFLFMI